MTIQRYNSDLNAITKQLETVMPNGIPEAPQEITMQVNVSRRNACFMYLTEAIQQLCEMAYFEKGLTFPYTQDDTAKYIRTLVVNRVRWLQLKENRRFKLRPIVDPRNTSVIYPAVVNAFLAGLGYCEIEDLNVVVTKFIFDGEVNAVLESDCRIADGIYTERELTEYCKALFLIKGQLHAVNQTVATYEGAPDLCGFQVEFGNEERPQMVVRSVLKTFAQPYALVAMALGLSGIGTMYNTGFYRGSQYEANKAMSYLVLRRET